LAGGTFVAGAVCAGGWAGAVVCGTASEIADKTNAAIGMTFNLEVLMNCFEARFEVLSLNVKPSEQP
jgi:hypothetical protein